jgi:hypothetical protein
MSANRASPGEASQRAEFSGFNFTLTEAPDMDLNVGTRTVGRYYATALSTEDKDALATGELNHNLKEWTPEDLLRFHDSRLNLIHPGPEDQKAMVEQLMDEREKSEKFISELKKKKLVSHFLPFFDSASSVSQPMRPYRGNTSKLSVSVVPLTDDEQACQQGAHMRSSSAPVSPAFRSTDSSLSRPPIPSQLKSQTSVSGLPSRDPHQVPFVEADMHPSVRSWFGRSSSDLELTRPQSEHDNRRPNGLRHSSYVTNELTPLGVPSGAPMHQARPAVTFDAFLAPHVLGKGEAFRGAPNALAETSEDSGSSSKSKTCRRLSKMPSMPLLRRKNRNENGEAPH